MKAKANPVKGYYAIHNITTTNPNLNINPAAMLAGSPENIVLTYNSNTPDIIDVHGCHNVDPELKIFAETPKNFTIEFYRLCETDDDIQLVMPGNLVANPNDPIIAPGPDQSIDRWANSAAWCQGDDHIWTNPMDNLRYIVAGPNLIAETAILPHNTTCTNAGYSANLDIIAFNNIYSKVAVNAVNIAVVDLYFNFNSVIEDNILDPNEQQHLHNARFLGGFLNDNTEVYIASDLGLNANENTVQGQSTNFGANTIALDRDDANANTLAHEVGHAKYGLIHPHEEFNNNIPDSKYSTNFMYWTSTGRTNVIRRYQFDEIH